MYDNRIPSFRRDEIDAWEYGSGNRLTDLVSSKALSGFDSQQKTPSADDERMENKRENPLYHKIPRQLTGLNKAFWVALSTGGLLWGGGGEA